MLPKVSLLKKMYTHLSVGHWTGICLPASQHRPSSCIQFAHEPNIMSFDCQSRLSAASP